MEDTGSDAGRPQETSSRTDPTYYIDSQQRLHAVMPLCLSWSRMLVPHPYTLSVPTSTMAWSSSIDEYTTGAGHGLWDTQSYAILHTTDTSRRSMPYGFYVSMDRVLVPMDLHAYGYVLLAWTTLVGHGSMYRHTWGCGCRGYQ